MGGAESCTCDTGVKPCESRTDVVPPDMAAESAMTSLGTSIDKIIVNDKIIAPAATRSLAISVMVNERTEVVPPDMAAESAITSLGTSNDKISKPGAGAGALQKGRSVPTSADVPAAISGEGDGVSEAVEEWHVEWKDGGVRVRQEMADSSEVLRVCSTGSRVRGHRNGDWLVLSEEPGFMRIQGHSGLSLLRRVVDAEAALPWAVAWPEGVYIRSTKDTAAAVFGQLEVGTLVHGLQCGEWLELTDRPGFVLATVDGWELIRAAHVVDWRVAWQDGVNLRSAMDTGAQVLKVLPQGEVVSGRVRGQWIELMNEPGFAKVSTPAGVVLLEQYE